MRKVFSAKCHSQDLVGFRELMWWESSYDATCEDHLVFVAESIEQQKISAPVPLNGVLCEPVVKTIESRAE